ncbi:pirin family protein [Actinosynnema sp. CA-248983]
MSNVEATPVEVVCGATTAHRPVEVLKPRDVPLGGPRAMSVRRTLPQRDRTMIGAWCFADHYGPDDVSETGGMDVAPHPHTGLQTASWLFTGEIEHRDSLGVHAMVRPGELNLMTGGAGICHSEVSTSNTTTLHGVQLWIALPDAHRNAPRNFQHHAPDPITIDGATVRVFLGTLCDETSPVETFTPLLGAELVLAPRADLALTVSPEHEHGLLLDQGTATLNGTLLAPGELAHTATGPTTLHVTNRADTPARAVLLGGTPFGEEIVMWWNFVARTHEEIETFRAEWQAESPRFGQVPDYKGNRLPAPPLPTGRLRPRGNPT